MPTRPALRKIHKPFDETIYHPPLTQAFGVINPGLEPLAWSYGDGTWGFKWLSGATQQAIHLGLDWGLAAGVPVIACADGRVQSAGWDPYGFGNLTILAHDGGLLTFYAHQQRITCTVGQQVRDGAKIGTIGSTGNSTGSHMHMACAWDDGAGYFYFCDPNPYLLFEDPPAVQLPTAERYTVLVDMFLRTEPKKDAPHGRFVRKGEILTAMGGWTTHWREISPDATWAYAVNLSSA